MGTSELVQLLGKPTLSRENVITYWTADRQYFLSVLSKDNVVQEVAFSSPAFKTDAGIGLANFESHKDKFVASHNTSGDTVLTLNGGGFKIAEISNPKATIGIVYPTGATSNPTIWWNLDPRSNTGSGNSGSGSTKVSQHSTVSDAAGKDDLSSSKAITLSEQTSAQVATQAKSANSDTLVSPGVCLAKIRLGESRGQVLKLLGKPSEENGSHMTYWTKDRKTFLTISAQNDVVSEIVFSSKIFATANGINSGNFDSAQFSKDFLPAKDLSTSNSRIWVSKEGGLSFIRTGLGKAYGWLYPKGARTDVAPWTPLNQ